MACEEVNSGKGLRLHGSGCLAPQAAVHRFTSRQILLHIALLQRLDPFGQAVVLGDARW